MNNFYIFNTILLYKYFVIDKLYQNNNNNDHIINNKVDNSHSKENSVLSLFSNIKDDYNKYLLFISFVGLVGGKF